MVIKEINTQDGLIAIIAPKSADIVVTKTVSKSKNQAKDLKTDKSYNNMTTNIKYEMSSTEKTNHKPKSADCSNKANSKSGRSSKWASAKH